MTAKQDSPWSILIRFFLLGCVSFGGPAAHIGYFRKRFVEQEKWLDDEAYGRLVALSQFLPGPGSSQVGFALGYRRAGVKGAIAAFIGFTLPSFLLLYFLAVMSAGWDQSPLFHAITSGLKLLAVVVVADAVWGMANKFCQSQQHWVIAIFSAAALLIAPSMAAQITVLIIAAVIGIFSTKASKPFSFTAQNETATRFSLWPQVLLCIAVLAALIPFSPYWQKLYGDFFQVGALVFGGGHVVLPLLQNTTGEWLNSDTFLTGYAAAQAVPGPMFTLATFLGAALSPEAPFVGAALATIAIFLPGLLLVLVCYDRWEALAAKPKVAGAAAAINAAVVGLLLAALYQPVFVSAVFQPTDLAIVLLGLFALRSLKWPVMRLILVMLAIALVRYWIG